MSGLVLGEKSTGFRDMDEDFRRSGTYHLLVASGSNVGIALALWFFVARCLLFLSHRMIWAVSPLVAFLYAGLAGADPPVLRAAWMASLTAVGVLLARTDRKEHALAFSAGILLLIRPHSLFQPGFLMSYAATLGLALVWNPSVDIEERSLWQKFYRGVAQLFCLSFSAQLALAPFLIYYFHSFSWIGIFANMVAVPWAGVCLTVGLLLFGADLIFPSGGTVVALFALLGEKAVRTLGALATFFSNSPGASWPLPWSGVQVLLFSILVAMAFTTLFYKSWWVWVLGLWVVGLPLIVWMNPVSGRGTVGVTWVDVGLGDAIVVFSPKNHVTVVDAGNRAGGLYQLVPFLQSRGVRRVDRLILTCPSPSHADGIGPLARALPVKEFLCTESVWKDPLWAQARLELERCHVPQRFLAPGDHWEKDGIFWKVYGPDMALELRYGEKRVLLTSDISPDHQRSLLSSLSTGIEVLQWPGHGRVTPHSPFLVELRPRWIVLSGDNPKGFVRSFPVWDTSRRGSVEWRSNGQWSRLDSLAQAETPVFLQI
jgi:competence protein ComEC